MGSWRDSEFPFLNDENHEVTSPCTAMYNCIGWAMGEDDRKWWPIDGYYWPNDDRNPTVTTFERVLRMQGYKRCPDGGWDPDAEKIVIYTIGSGRKMEVTHAARQIGPDRWTSKIGTCEDIMHHEPRNLRGPLYGKPYAYYCRNK